MSDITEYLVRDMWLDSGDKIRYTASAFVWTNVLRRITFQQERKAHFYLTHIGMFYLIHVFNGKEFQIVQFIISFPVRHMSM